MRKDGYCVDISLYKRIKNTKYNGATFITFEQDFKSKEGVWLKSWINLTLEEWTEFIKILWKLDQIFGLGKVKTCFVCNDLRTVVEQQSRTTTKLSEGDYTNLVIANSIGEEPARCEFCGEVELPFECHCHDFNCRICSWFNFCDGCGSSKFHISD